MRNSPIQIGPINLENFEIPPSVRFGGRHRLAVHILSSGERVVERLGPEDGEIVFKGTFSGPNAEARVQLFDNLRLSGEVVWLTWESFRRRVVVKSFVADYHSPGWIPYHVSCTVVHQAGVAAAVTSVLATLISADLDSAFSAAAGSAIQLTSLRTSLSSTNALTTGTSDHAQALAAIGVTLNAIDTQIAQDPAKFIGPTGPNRSAKFHAEAMAAAVIYAGSLASTVNTRSYIGRIGTNLTSLGN